VNQPQGGLIARALFVIPGFDAAHTVITQATPHRRPVIALDPYVADFYERVNSYWLHNGSRKHQDVLLVSTGGGYRDILVRDGLTLLDEVGLYGRACNSEWRFKFEL
jgi:PGAP1-like protein